MHDIRTALRRALPAALAVPALVLAAPGAAQEHQHHAPPPRAGGAPALLEGLGSHHHAITTSGPLAQRWFDQGLSLAYAFNHAEARSSFLEAARLDPECAMCQWGVAYVLGPNINMPMDTAANAEAYAAARRAVALAARRGTPAERALADAMARRYAATAPRSRAGLDSAYARAMREVARRFPDDPDAAALHAEARMDLSPWAYWSKERRPLPGTSEMLAALEGEIRRNPSHPGACHLYIHAVEAAYPERAVPCAERLAALMPAAGHIVHMPAHIYLRVGRYDDAIVANEQAVHVDERYIADRNPHSQYTVAYYPHNWHFLSYAATMAGRRETAVTAARAAAANTPPDVARDVPEIQLLSAAPHLTLVTFERWEDALREPLPRADLRLATALAWYARGMARAATGRLPEASAALDSVRGAAKVVTADPGAKVLRIAERSLLGELAARRGDLAGAAARLREAMTLEDGMSYTEPPYWPEPVRHHLGAVLTKAGEPAAAERLYREDLRRFPENVWSLRGLERSLTAQGKTAEAADVRQRFARAAQLSDVTLGGSRY
ncbi:MAG: tetratricopeptide repeat protein [Gemmatimonadaceae bacterium]